MTNRYEDVQRNFVSPGQAEPVTVLARRESPAVDVAPVRYQIDTPMPVQTRQTLTTSHVDRAQGFTIATVPLAAVVGFVAFLLLVTLAGVPVLSGLAVVVLFGVFALVWLLAWVWYQSASPDGVALWQTLLMFRLLRHEQRARLRRMERDE